MKRLNFANTNNKRIILTLSFALILLATTTLTGTSSLQFIKSAMAKKDNKVITTADIADNAVTSPKIKDGEVKSQDLADGAITTSKVSTGLMRTITLNDDATGHTHGWDPDGVNPSFIISDIGGLTFDSTVTARILQPGSAICAVSGVIPGTFYFDCDRPVADTQSLTFTVINAPTTACCSSASSITSSTSKNNFSPPSVTDVSPFANLHLH